MRWELGRRSENIEDRRGVRAGPGIAIGGTGLLIILGLALLTGQDPLQLLQVVNDASVSTQPGPGSYQRGGPMDKQADFVSVVLADTEDTWGSLLSERGQRYAAPTLVMFTDAVQSACGMSSAAVGPFYCPPDAKVFIDLSFFADLDNRFGAPGDFAQAYVIAHEVGHHVQNLLGIASKVNNARARVDPEQANEMSVRLELQADCFAGVWAHHANRQRQLLEPGDLEEGLTAAAAIGDDRLQRQSQGYVAPESFTHGTSQQRVRWFRRGFDSGAIDSCDTFGASNL